MCKDASYLSVFIQKITDGDCYSYCPHIIIIVLQITSHARHSHQISSMQFVFDHLQLRFINNSDAVDRSRVRLSAVIPSDLFVHVIKVQQRHRFSRAIHIVSFITQFHTQMDSAVSVFGLIDKGLFIAKMAMVFFSVTLHCLYIYKLAGCQLDAFHESLHESFR